MAWTCGKTGRCRSCDDMYQVSGGGDGACWKAEEDLAEHADTRMLKVDLGTSTTERDGVRRTQQRLKHRLKTEKCSAVIPTLTSFRCFFLFFTVISLFRTMPSSRSCSAPWEELNFWCSYSETVTRSQNVILCRQSSSSNDPELVRQSSEETCKYSHQLDIDGVLVHTHSSIVAVSAVDCCPTGQLLLIFHSADV